MDGKCAGEVTDLQVSRSDGEGQRAHTIDALAEGWPFDVIGKRSKVREIANFGPERAKA